LLGAKRTTITVHRSEEILPRDTGGLPPSQLGRQGTSVSSGEDASAFDAEFGEGGSERYYRKKPISREAARRRKRRRRKSRKQDRKMSSSLSQLLFLPSFLFFIENYVNYYYYYIKSSFSFVSSLLIHP
jgi:hypothetical protein